jgi:hypothetical protein
MSWGARAKEGDGERTVSAEACAEPTDSDSRGCLVSSKTRSIVVTGDVSIDWLLLSSPSGGRGAVDFIWMWGGAYPCRALVSSGGAAAHAEILRSAVAAAGREDVQIVGPEVPAEVLSSPLHPAYTHTFARLEPFPRQVGVAGQEVWRIAEFMGSDPARQAPAGVAEPLPGIVDTLMIVDHAMGYRDRAPGLAELLAAGPRTIVWQTGAPLTGSALADALLNEHVGKLTVITSSDDLRKAGAQVGYALSWEQLTEEILAAVKDHAMSQARRVIVIVGAVGALIVEREGEDILVFDPRSQESDWGKRYPGVGAAYGRCIDAAVVLDVAGGGAAAPVESLKRGLAAARAAHIAGFLIEPDRGVAANPFPLQEVAQALLRDSGEFASVVYRPAAGASILAQTYGEAVLAEVAARTAVNGIASLPHGIPVETVGAWSSVDRTEIENLRSVRNIMEEYVRQEPRAGYVRRPLAIAVFGPPGAGKTFAVREMARVLLPGGLRTLEFDLSQLHSEADLRSALHEVRDAALEGDLPLVLWDEFDSPLNGEPLGWLRHFLAPTEDGRFREGTSFHPVGPAIFVFVGGTAARFDEFVASADERAAKVAKKPDFVSRLRGYVNVMGPNRQNADDVAWPLRRALLLRSLVAQRAPQMMLPGTDGPRLDIDEGVLRAFLLIGEYIHGARSLEAILEMSSLSGKPRFERSSLPARQQLAVHVDADLFLKLVRS